MATSFGHVRLGFLATTIFLFLLLGAGRANERMTPGQWEALYLDSVSAQGARDYLFNYTSTAHLAGTLEDYDTALRIREEVPL